MNIIVLFLPFFVCTMCNSRAHEVCEAHDYSALHAKPKQKIISRYDFFFLFSYESRETEKMHLYARRYNIIVAFFLFICLHVD